MFNYQTVITHFHRGLFIVIAAGCATLLTACQQEADAKASGGSFPPAAVKTTKAELGNMQQSLTVVGSLVASAQAVISAELAGRIEHVAAKDGQFVEKGSLLFSINAQALTAELKGANAEVRLREDEIKRVKALLKKRVASQYDLDKAHALLDTALAKVELAEAKLSHANIVAPFSGFLGISKVNQGEYVREATPLINLVRLQPLYVDFQTPETALLAVTAGKKLTVYLPALNGLKVSADVIALEPAIDEKTRSLMVRASIDNSEGKLRPGLFARVELPLKSADDVLWLPEAALFLKGGKNFVLVNDDGKALRKPVEVLSHQHGRVAIASGITAADEVVTAGHHKVPFDGMSLMVMNADENAATDTDSTK